MKQRLRPAARGPAWKLAAIAANPLCIWVPPAAKTTLFCFQSITTAVPRNSSPVKNISIPIFLTPPAAG